MRKEGQRSCATKLVRGRREKLRCGLKMSVKGARGKKFAFSGCRGSEHSAQEVKLQERKGGQLKLGERALTGVHCAGESVASHGYSVSAGFHSVRPGRGAPPLWPQRNLRKDPRDPVSSPTEVLASLVLRAVSPIELSSRFAAYSGFGPGPSFDDLFSSAYR